MGAVLRKRAWLLIFSAVGLGLLLTFLSLLWSPTWAGPSASDATAQTDPVPFTGGGDFVLPPTQPKPPVPIGLSSLSFS